MTSRERRALLEDIFQHAADLSGQARSSYVLSRCAGDDELKREVEALLHELDTGTRGVLAAQAVPMPDFGPPRNIAGFQIVRELGRGGMGVVYQAIQQSPRRAVALKVMRWDAITPAGVRRFAREAEVLGQLKHPGIAQIYQAGMVNLDGREQPYFAMEFVSGPDLKTYCDQSDLSRRDRLALIVLLCEAVQYAHGRGFIHRDLKPGNVLVEPPPLDTDPLGQPKILDFGIARATGSDEPSNTLRTHTGQIVGTLAYMSPEQAAGDSTKIDARCDVYALGAIAYELLTGQLPLTLSGRTVPEAMRIVIEQDPPSLRTIDRSLAGDLDAIVARALEKDVSRRYQSAAELAADIDRYLRGEPVLARPASATYQFSKFARRNKILVGGVVGIILALSIGLVSTLVMYQKAQHARELAAEQAARAAREADRASAIKDYLLADMIQAASPDRDGYEVRVIDVLKHAADKVQQRFGKEPDLEIEVRGLLGDTFRLLGMRPEAITQQQARIAVLERTQPNATRDLAMVYGDLASAFSLNDQPKEAETAARHALALLGTGDGDDDLNKLSISVALGTALQSQGKFAEAEPLLRDCLARQERLQGRASRPALITLSILNATVQAQGKTDEALELSREFVKRSVEGEGASRQSTVIAINNLCTALQSAGHYDEAWEYARDLPERVEKLFPAEHPFRLVALITAGSAARRVNRNDDAIRLLTQAVDLATTNYGPGDYQTERAISRLRDVYRAIGNIDKAIEWGRLAVRARLMVAGPGEWESVINAMTDFESFSRKRDRAADADILAWLQTTTDQAAPPGTKSRARYLGNLGTSLIVVGRLDQGERTLHLAEQSLDTANVSQVDARDNRTIIYTALAKLAEIRGKPDEAAAYRAKIEK